MFGFLMASGHSGFRHGPGETGKNLQKSCFYVVVSQGNSGNKVEWRNGDFLISSQIIVLKFVYSIFF